MNYDLKMHLASTADDLFIGYRNQNLELFENSYDLLKDILNKDKVHSEFLQLLAKNEQQYRQSVKSTQKNLVKSLLEGLDVEKADESVLFLDGAIKGLDVAVQQHYAQHVQDRKDAITSYLPHIKVA